jgi:hypothetical protein
MEVKGIRGDASDIARFSRLELDKSSILDTIGTLEKVPFEQLNLFGTTFDFILALFGRDIWA